MPQMPLDVLIEIFAFMHPRDLLNLARTTKPFRSLLMAKTARKMWEAVMARVEGLLPCPPYMSEPAYINLLFFSHCHSCLKSNIQNIIFEFGVRYCNRCRSDLILRMDACADVHFRINPLKGSLERCFSYEVGKSDDRKWFHKPELETFCKRWDSLEDDLARKALIEEYAARVRLIDEAVGAYLDWKSGEKARRAAELEEIRATRVRSIRDRLRQEGWGEEFDKMSPNWQSYLELENFSAKPEPLTDRRWQNIRQDAVSFMERAKSDRLAQERKLVLLDRLSKFSKAYEEFRSPMAVLRDAKSDLDPLPMDLAMMSEFKDILNDVGGADMSVLEDREQMRPMFESATARWRQERREELTAKIRASNILVPPDIADPLTLAISLFGCKACSRRDLQYPAVLTHLCNRRYDLPADDYEVAVQCVWSPNNLRTSWRSKYLFASVDAASHLRPILQACGLDPDHATHRDVDQSKAVLIFTGSASWSRGSKINADGTPTLIESYIKHEAFVDCWRALSYRLRHPQLPSRWERVSDNEAKKIQDKEWESYAWVDMYKTTLGCKYCPFAIREEHMPRHLKKRHDIDADEGTIYDHSYQHEDAAPEYKSIYLKRHDNGTSEAYFNKFESDFGLFSLFMGADGDSDAAEWDSDMDF
ncbi:hypothetical protein BD311DRAFT_654742 [Dichomitus squalens]|uniref:F-box domain-containing protein n=1 Tax=Dichomitus squalens TaxID=114155 RepID=A0A4V2K1E8_9APHY|nr:hypothetical protein BD311DRAFT_654742 [Dichomitus squalens]